MFNKSVAILLSGTAFSQLIGIVVLPVLTRLYSPEQMGILAVYTATVTILLTIVCLRLESAIPIQADDSDARNVLVLCVQIALGTSFLAFICSLALKYSSVKWLQDFDHYLLYVPLGMFVGGVYIAVNAYALKRERFDLVSKSRMMQALSCALVQTSGALLYQSAMWLIIGFILNLGAGIRFLKNKLNISKLFDFSDIKSKKDIFILNSNFPKYSVVESLSNAAGVQVPILLIAYGMSVSDAAFLFLAMKLIQAPMALLGSSISQVFYTQANDKLLNGELTQFTTRVLETALKIGVGPIIAISIIAPLVTQKILGDDWSVVGDYIFLMAPWFVIQFIASPISPIMYVMSKQKAFMYLTLFGLVWKLGLTFFAVINGSYIIEILVLSNVIFYLFCFIVFFSVAGITYSVVMRVLLNSSLSILCWVLVSIFIILLFGE